MLAPLEPARLVELIELAGGVDPVFARNLLAVLHTKLPGREIKRLRRGLSALPGGWVRRAEELFDAVHDRLHPELCLHESIFEDLDGDEEMLPAFGGPIPPGLFDPEEAIVELLSKRVKKPAIAREIAQLLMQDPTPLTERRMNVLLKQVRLTIDEIFDLLPETL